MRLTRFPELVATFCVVLTAACGGGGSEPSVGPPAAVSAVGGSNATLTAGTTAPVALTAKVADAGGHGVSGATVAWGTGSGTISPATAATDANGQATAQWTPGKVAGTQTATATVSGVGAATFTATISPGPLARIKITPDTSKLGAAGTTSQLAATGFDAFDNLLTGFTPVYTIDDPQIATVSGTGLLTSVSTGTTTVRATSGGITGTATVVVNASAANPCAGVTMNLAVGASQTLTGTAANQFCVTGAAGAEFVAVPFYGTGNGGTGSGTTGVVPAPSLTFSLTGLGNSPVLGPPTPSVSSGIGARASVVSAPYGGLTRDVAWESRMRERMRKQFAPLRASVRRRLRNGSASKTNVSGGLRANVLAAAVPAPGSTIQLNVNVNQSCSNVQLVDAKVWSVSNHAIVVADVNNPANGFTQADYDSFATVFDNQIWTVDTDNFGPPTDIDSTGHVILFFTQAVNKLTTTPGSNSFVGGFFLDRDLFFKADDCGGGAKVIGSNQAEMFYLLAPDPSGSILPGKNARSTSLVKSITPGTIAHEFQHLINFGYRLYDPTNFSDANFPEQTFLDEGLSHIAEELNYYAATSHTPRNNIDASVVANPDDAYQAYARQNALRFSDYLKGPDKYAPYSVLADTSLSVRGGIWSFLRYAADRKGGLEKATWMKLERPGQDVGGMTNLAATFGANFTDVAAVLAQMRDWTVANYLDDAGVPNIAAIFTHPSWNTRSVETFVNGTFPLPTTTLLGTANRQISLGDGGAAYVRFAVPAGSVGGATVTSGSALPSTFSITVVRTK